MAALLRCLRVSIPAPAPLGRAAVALLGGRACSNLNLLLGTGLWPHTPAVLRALAPAAGLAALLVLLLLLRWA